MSNYIVYICQKGRERLEESIALFPEDEVIKVVIQDGDDIETVRRWTAGIQCYSVVFGEGSYDRLVIMYAMSRLRTPFPYDEKYFNDNLHKTLEYFGEDV